MQKMIGRDLIDNKDVDGKEFMKERVAMMKKQESGWQNYKFRNPTTNQIEPKAMYIERVNDVIVGCRVYVEVTPDATGPPPVPGGGPFSKATCSVGDAWPGFSAKDNSS